MDRIKKMKSFLLYFVLTVVLVLTNNTNVYATETVDSNNIEQNYIIENILTTQTGSSSYSKNFVNYIINDLNMKQDDLNINRSHIISIKSSDSSVAKVKSNFQVEWVDAGAGYLDITIKESENYKQFVARYFYVVRPPFIGGYTSPRNIEGDKGKKIKNTLYFCFLATGHDMSEYVGRKSKCRVEIATDKNFKKIVKRYTYSPKQFNKGKSKSIKNIKKLGLKKNKTYYLRAYSYRDYKFNGYKFRFISRDGAITFKFKVNKKYYIKNNKRIKNTLTTDTNDDIYTSKKILDLYGIEYETSEDYQGLDLYKK